MAKSETLKAIQSEKKARIKQKIKDTQAELRKNFKTERQEQPEFLTAFRKTYPGVLIFSIPNGANAGSREKSKLKSQGLLSGVPDLFIPAWKLFIELKQSKSGRTSDKQDSVIAQLQELGYNCIVANGAEDAMAKCKHLLR